MSYLKKWNEFMEDIKRQAESKILEILEKEIELINNFRDILVEYEDIGHDISVCIIIGSGFDHGLKILSRSNHKISFLDIYSKEVNILKKSFNKEIDLLDRDIDMRIILTFENSHTVEVDESVFNSITNRVKLEYPYMEYDFSLIYGHILFDFTKKDLI